MRYIAIAMPAVHLAAILHRIDPFAIHFWGEVGIRWYGLSYMAGFAFAFGLIYWMAKRGRTPMPPPRVADFVVTVAIGTIVGGRLGYCLFYQRELFIDFGGGFPWWGVLKVWHGGMASHGGILGIVAACLYFARKHKLPVLHLFDLTTLGGSVGIFFGRIANFVNGELLGRPAGEELRWAVMFPQELRADDLNDPRMQPIIERVTDMMFEGVIRPTEDMLHAIQVAVQQNDEVAKMIADSGVLTPRHPSQLYAALLEGLFMFVALSLIWWKPRKPGVVGGWFLVLYAIVRIVGEQFRMPDDHIADQEFAWLGITRGQLLSGFMLLIGIGCLVWWSRRKVDRISGLGRKVMIED